MKTGYLRQDESGHWYLVPTEEIVEFDAIVVDIIEARPHSDEWYDLIDEFSENFSQYRTDGYGNKEVIINDSN